MTGSETKSGENVTLLAMVPGEVTRLIWYIRYMYLAYGYDTQHTLIDVMMATTGLSLVISNTS